MQSTFSIVIPARYASTRFPGKPLADLNGKTMIRRVFEAASAVPGAQEVIIATDDEKIYDHTHSFARTVLTRPDHPSGTDRCAEILGHLMKPCDVVVNLQGDEPFIRPEQVLQLVGLFSDPGVQIGTLKKALYNAEETDNPNTVKVVCDRRGRALYFSRSRIPYYREPGPEVQYFRHIGMYAYRVGTLQEISGLQPSVLENAEKLEQLRWLEAGYHIAVAETNWQSPAIDTPEDLEKALLFMKNLSSE
ncbi:MAG: 3-deoxy-manno-octulosonate cytidylyltransferase [Bacteroidetes bacterium]|nr:3-deoxy-manno-octulosonate cytidylyltransferase [Bacteroidota bacterium]